MAVEVRGARAEEMPEVLDMVPRVMGATREYFAAAYRNDSCARPEHSRIARVDGHIVSHLRLYDRWQRVGSVPVHVGCVGDVCTLPEYRKQGCCRALLQDAVRYWDENGYDLSMIVSGVGVYAACGWAPLAEQKFELPAENRHEAKHDREYEIRRFVRGEDLTAAAALYATYNADRSLSTVRTSGYWERHFAWIAGEIEEAFLVAERGGQIVAYLRCERGGPKLILSECCHLSGHERAAVALLDAALTFAAKHGLDGIQGHLPSDHPALAAARARPAFSTAETAVLWFRLVNLRRLLERLRPQLAERTTRAEVEGQLALKVDGHEVGVRVLPGWVNIGEPEGDPVDLEPRHFFALLFGAPLPRDALAGLPATTVSVLGSLFPPGAPVYWRTDVV